MEGGRDRGGARPKTRFKLFAHAPHLGSQILRHKKCLLFSTDMNNDLLNTHSTGPAGKRRQRVCVCFCSLYPSLGSATFESTGFVAKLPVVTLGWSVKKLFFSFSFSQFIDYNELTTTVFLTNPKGEFSALSHLFIHPKKRSEKNAKTRCGNSSSHSLLLEQLGQVIQIFRPDPGL